MFLEQEKAKKEDEEREKRVSDSVRIFKKQILDEIEITERKNKINSDQEKNKFSSWDKKIEEKKENFDQNREITVSDEFIDLKDSRIEGSSSCIMTAQPIVLYWSEIMDLALGREIRLCLFDFNLISKNLTGDYN